MKINREELLRALLAVKPALAAKEAIAQSSSFIFPEEGGICTFNDEVAISIQFPVGLNGAVPAQELYNLITKSRAEEVEINATETELKISAGRARSGILMDAEIKEPAQAAMEATKKRKRWHALPEDFVEGVKMCAFSAGHTSTDPAMSSLHLTGNVIESCDNQRLTRFYFFEAADKKPLFASAMLIPVKSMQLITKYQPTDFAFEDGWAYFKNAEDVILSLRTIVGQEYPDLTPFIEKTEGVEVEVPADEIIAMLETAGAFAEDQDSSAPKVNIKLAENWFMVRTANSVGWFEEKVRTRYKGEPLEFIVNPNFLRDILDKLTAMTITERTLHFSTDEFVHVCVYSKPVEPPKTTRRNKPEPPPEEVTDLEPF